MELSENIGPCSITHISEFMQLDDDHINFRRFKRLHLWTTLRLQHRLIKLDDRVARYENSPYVSAPDGDMLSEATELLEKYGTVPAVESRIVRLTRCRPSFVAA